MSVCLSVCSKWEDIKIFMVSLMTWQLLLQKYEKERKKILCETTRGFADA